jgi:hypothetical protein
MKKSFGFKIQSGELFFIFRLPYNNEGIIFFVPSVQLVGRKY